MNNQHMNGGIEVDIWGQTSLPGCFAVGKLLAHGVTRHGGAALNAGRVLLFVWHVLWLHAKAEY